MKKKIIRQDKDFSILYLLTRDFHLAKEINTVDFTQAMEKKTASDIVQPHDITAGKTHHCTLQLNQVTDSSLQLIQTLLALQCLI